MTDAFHHCNCEQTGARNPRDHRAPHPLTCQAARPYIPQEDPHLRDIATTVRALPWTGTTARLGEAVAIALAIAVFVQTPTPGGFLTAVIVAGIAYAATVDLISMRIPNVITYTGTLLLLPAAAIAGLDALGSALLGALIAGGLVALIVFVSRGQMGLGDLKLSILGGALVGGQYALPALLAGSLSALPVTAVLLLTRRISRRQPIPYGPYLAFGFILVTLLAGSVLTR